MQEACANSSDCTIAFEGFRWIDIAAHNQQALFEVGQRYGFHGLDVENCLAKTHLPKITAHPEYLFIVLHVPRYLKDRKYSVPEQVAIFMGREFIVTVHSGVLKPIARVWAQCQADQGALGPLEEGMSMSPALLLYRLIDELFEDFFNMLGKVRKNIEAIEDMVFDDKVNAARDITDLRHDVANLRQIFFPLRSVVYELEKMSKHRFPDGLSAYYGDLSDTAQKIRYLLDEYKRTTEIYMDTDFVMSTERTNKILTLLTILFTFSIPFTLLGTFYGMNINLPGGERHPWAFWGTYSTFYVVLIAAAIPVCIMFVVFKRLRWL